MVIVQQGSRAPLALAVLAAAAGIIGLVAQSATAAKSAPRDVEIVGQTQAEVKVKLTVGYSGNATAFRIAGSNIKCEGGKLSTRGVTYDDFNRSDPGEFHDKERTSMRVGAFRFKTAARIRGAMATDGYTWTGKYEAVTRVFERGVRVDTCTVDTIWHVYETI